MTKLHNESISKEFKRKWMEHYNNKIIFYLNSTRIIGHSKIGPVSQLKQGTAENIQVNFRVENSLGFNYGIVIFITSQRCYFLIRANIEEASSLQ